MAFRKLKKWASALKRDVVALWIAARDPATPLVAKIGAGAVAAYALSPVDLIPDFIPVIGYLDDLLIVPIGIAIVVRAVPAPLMDRFRAMAERRTGRPTSRVTAVLIVVLWLAAMGAAAIRWQPSLL